MIDEELILATLFERVASVSWLREGDDPAQPRTFVTTDRRVRLFADVPSNQHPACFQAEWGTDELQQSNLPYKATITANWIVFQCVGKDKKAKGTIENNLILGGIRKALAPLPSDPGFHDKRNTLGGLVYHCFISGRIFKDPGDIDDQGMIGVAIKLLVP